MAKSKRAKLQKAFSPSSSSPSVPDDNADDPDLMDELLAHLDSKDASVREESATVIAEVQSREVADASPPPKKDSKSRYLARQVFSLPVIPIPLHLTGHHDHRPKRLLLSHRIKAMTIRRLRHSAQQISRMRRLASRACATTSISNFTRSVNRPSPSRF